MMNNLVKRLLNNVERNLDSFDIENMDFASDKNFYRYLRMDGYDIDFERKCIKEGISNLIQTRKKDVYIMEYLKEHEFTIAL